MVSPELLRRYPFFGFLAEDELRAVAMIASEVSVPAGARVFEEGQPADALYFLIEGAVEHVYIVADEFHPERRKELVVGEVNPGEIFGISALIEPFVMTTTARAPRPSRVLRVDGAALRGLCEVDPKLAFGFAKQVARAAMERLHATRVLLAAERH